MIPNLVLILTVFYIGNLLKTYYNFFQVSYNKRQQINVLIMNDKEQLQILQLSMDDSKKQKGGIKYTEMKSFKSNIHDNLDESMIKERAKEIFEEEMQAVNLSHIEKSVPTKVQDNMNIAVALKKDPETEILGKIMSLSKKDHKSDILSQNYIIFLPNEQIIQEHEDYNRTPEDIAAESFINKEKTGFYHSKRSSTFKTRISVMSLLEERLTNVPAPLKNLALLGISWIIPMLLIFITRLISRRMNKINSSVMKTYKVYQEEIMEILNDYHDNLKLMTITIQNSQKQLNESLDNIVLQASLQQVTQDDAINKIRKIHRNYYDIIDNTVREVCTQMSQRIVQITPARSKKSEKKFLVCLYKNEKM
ncbi:uncharacterized protein [Periplaneta americana]|uniref:uncharacterized protein n=1 Tax=Periplaneta americana TaxID=6978 RepID=UPI0037E73880